MEATAQEPKKRRLQNALRRRGWNYRTPENGIRHRIYDLVACRNPWWDWGHRMMILTGTDFGGNWSEPEPPTWWYTLGAPKRMWRTGYPIHPLSTFKVVKNYDEFSKLTEDLNEDQMYEWKAFNINQDGELQVGHLYWGQQFYGMSRWEARLLAKYLRMCRRHDWYGLRSWLYSQGLKAAVYQRKPFSCQMAPPRDSNGYDHWLCQLPMGHSGLHRYNNWTWE